MSVKFDGLVPWQPGGPAFDLEEISGSCGATEMGLIAKENGELAVAPGKGCLPGVGQVVLELQEKRESCEDKVKC